MFSSPQASSPSCRQTRTKRGIDIKSLAKKVAQHVKRKIELPSSNTTIIDGSDMEAAIFQPEREHKVIMTLPLQQKPSSQSKLCLEFAMSWLMSTFNVGQMHIYPTMSLQKYANIQCFINDHHCIFPYICVLSNEKWQSQIKYFSIFMLSV